MMTMIVILTKISVTGLIQINNGMTDGRVGSIVNLIGQLQIGVNTMHGGSQTSHHVLKILVLLGMNNLRNHPMIYDDLVKKCHGLQHHHNNIMFEQFDVASKGHPHIILMNPRGSQMISLMYKPILTILVTTSHATNMIRHWRMIRHHNVHHPTVHDLVDVVNHEQVGGPFPHHTHVRRPWLRRQRPLYHEARQVSVCAKSSGTPQSF